MMAAQTH